MSANPALSSISEVIKISKIVVVGSLNFDTSIHVSHLPAKGETIIASHLSLHHGGKGANQAVAIARLGGQVSFIGAVGNDENGHQLINGLKKAGVDTTGIAIKDNAHTGMAFVCVAHSGENNIIVYPGTNYRITKEDIDRNRPLITDADYCLLQLEIPFEIVRYVIGICHEAKVKVVLNPAPVSADFDDRILAHVDYILPNETELAMMVGESVTMENIGKLASSLLAKGCGHAIVTLGENGSFLVDPVRQEHFPAVKVKAVDTTAAGDSFIGAFTYRLASGDRIDEAIRFATKAAAITVTRHGAQDALPSLEEVKNWLVS